jgi:hypothetical protein
MAPHDFGEGILGVLPGIAREQFQIGFTHRYKYNDTARSDPTTKKPTRHPPL